MAAGDEAKPQESAPAPAVESGEARVRGRSAAAEPAAIAAPAVDGELIAFTLDTATGRIAKIERIEASGGRRDLSPEDRARLLAKAAEVNLENVVERAFEAGLECALTDDDDDDADLEAAVPPTEEDVSLRHLVLRSLMAETVADRLIKREVLNRAIAGTLIRQGVGAQSSLAH